MVSIGWTGGENVEVRTLRSATRRNSGRISMKFQYVTDCAVEWYWLNFGVDQLDGEGGAKEQGSSFVRHSTPLNFD